MSKKRIKRLRKIVSIFSALFLLIYSFTPYLVLAPVRAQSEDQQQQTEVTAPQDGQSTPAPEVSSSTEPQPSVETTPSVTEEPTPPVEENVTPSDEQSPTQDNGPPADGSTSVEPTPVPSPEPQIEKDCLTDQAITDTTNDNWNIDIEKGTAETKDKVTLGVKYIFPQENKVTITFKCLPKDESLRTQLKIQKVKVSDLKLPEGTNPYGEYAYDITTGMQDGNFEYEITLPKPENKSAEVSYMEDLGSEVKTVDEGNTNQESDKIKVNSLDHFTIFFVSTTMSVYASFNGASQVTVYPSAPITVTLQVTTSGSSSSNDWSSSQYLIEGSSWSSCDNSPNFTNSGTNTDTIGITAPSLVGTYDLSLRVYNSNDCTGAAGTFAETTLTDAINVVVNTTIPFTETFGTSNNPTVTNWYETNPAEIISGSGADDPTSGQFAKIGNDGWICRPFDATGITAVGLSYDWKGNANSSGDLGVVEYKAGGSCGDSSGWNNLASNPLNDTSWGNQIHTFLGNGLFHLRFRTSNAESGEFFRVDNVNLATAATITIIKDTQPDDAQDFSFATTGTGLSSFSLDDDANGTLSNTKSFIGLSAGTYTVQEATQTGFDLAGLTCTDPTGNSTASLGTRTATINLATGESVTCTFVNAKRGHIIVTKDAVPNNAQDFSFTNNFGNENPASFNLDDDPSSGTLSNTRNSEVLPGTYSVSEAVVSGWTSNGGVCSDGSLVNAIQVSAGETVTCTFTNTLDQPDLIATKTNSVSNNATLNQAFTWTIRVKNSGTASVTIPGSVELLRDERPSTGVSSYGSPTATAGGGATGTVNCAQSGTNNRDLTCTTSGSVTMPINGYFDVVFTATPSATGSLANPRSSAVCRTDRNGSIAESDNNNNDCSNTLNVAAVQPASNPQLGQSCGLKTVFILDSSDSMSNGDIQDVKDAATTLVNALMPATPTQIGVIDFDTNVISSLSPTINKTDVLNAVNSIGHTSATEYTNWDEALQTADAMVGSGDLVVIITDGNPTVSNGPLSDLDDAIVRANAIKSGGTRILAIGIDSSGTSGGLDLPNLEAITGPNDVTIPPGTITNINNVDVVLGDVSQLGTVLSQLVTALCGGTINITKLVDGNPASGWTFNVTGKDPVVTNGNGGVSVAVNAGTYSVIETLKEGYSFGSASCTGAQDNGSPTTNGVSGIQVTNTNIVSCIFNNTTIPQTGTLIVRKIVSGVSPSLFYFRYQDAGGSGGAKYFDPSGVENLEVNAGTYNITEDTASTPDYTPSYDNCSNVVVTNGNSATCTITNTLQTGSISGRKFNDLDGNHVWDAGEPVVDGTVTPLQIFVDTNGNGQYDGPPDEYYATIDNLGRYSFGLLTPGQYNICEMDNELVGWTRTYPETSSCQPVQVNAGEDSIANFGNVQLSSITIRKDSIPNDGQDFNFTRDFGDSFILDDDSNVTRPNSMTFNDLIPGNYSVTEGENINWQLTGINCTGGQTSRDGRTININLGAGENISCTFVNRKYGTIVSYKYEDANNNGHFETGETRLDGWLISLYDSSWNLVKSMLTGDDSTEAGNVEPGHFTFKYLIPGTYYVCETLESGWIQTEPSSGSQHNGTYCRQVTLGAGGLIYGIPFGNVGQGSVIVTKYQDNNGDGVKDLGEQVLSGWDMRLYIGEDFSETQTTNASGVATFNNLLSRTYTLSETVKDDWTLTNISCSSDEPTISALDGIPQAKWTLVPVVNARREGSNPIDNDNSHDVSVFPGQTTTCEVGNRPPNPLVMIDKTNNTGGADQAPGNTVGYTITVTFSEGSVTNLQVTDLLPDGFTYNGGSYVVLLNGSPVPGLLEPSYASPGTWDLSLLGTLTPEDVVELQYTANIGGSQQQGLYKDLAWSEGQSLASIPVMARDVNDPTDPFVGTNVNVVTGQNTAASVSLNTKREETTTGEVLGASTGLPGTGGNTIWVVIASVLAALGGILAGLGLALKKGFKLPSLKNLTRFAVLLAALFLFTTQTQAGFSPLSLRLSIPKSPSNLSSFNLTYVALDTGGSPVTVKCYKQGPSDGGFVQFGSDIVTAGGGNTGSCLVDSSILTTVGTYLFKATAEAGGPVVDSDQIVSVDWNNNTNPGTPTGYSKGKLDTCTYQIKFRTADDSGKTVRAEVYRSINTSFSLDNSTRVANLNVGSGTDVSINNVVQDCTVENFYAVRAFDIFGNGSGVIGDSGIIVTYTSTGATTTTTTAAAGEVGGGALTVAGAGLPAETTQVLGTESAQPSGKPQEVGQPGESLGAAIAKKGLFRALVDYLKNPYISIPLVILVLVLVYVFTKKANKKPL